VTDAELREVYSRLVARRAPAVRDACVNPESLLAMVEGRTAEAERIQALWHVASCAPCRAELDLLRAVAQAGERLQRRHVPALALAASLALLAGTAVVWRGGVGPLAWRAEPLRGARGGVTLLEPSGEVAAATPVVLRWHALPRAVRYQVEVLDADGRVVFATSTHDTTAPMRSQPALIPGADYRWWVQAELADGTGPRSSAERFRVRGIVAPPPR